MMKAVKTEDITSSGEKFICLGDHISLFCTDTRGFVFTDRNGSSQNSVYVYTNQDQEKAENIPNPQVATFQVVTQNRYKLNKKYRRLKELADIVGDEEDRRVLDEDGGEGYKDEALEEAKRSAEAEEQDNSSELRRLRGRPVTYGDVVQLRHIFTQKYIHVDHNQTSIRDKSKLEVKLLPYNGKTAQFKIRPKYKVNTDGEMVQHGDQVTFESVKIPGQFLNASPTFDLPLSGSCCEINLAVQSAEFTIISRFQLGCDNDDFRTLWGGAVIQLFHKDLQGYLSADGVFTDGHTEDVHLRERPTNYLIPKTLYPSTSCTTFWQVEAENSSMDGCNICWGSHLRIRHLNTRLYLTFKDGHVHLTPNPNDPNTVFMFRPLHKEEGPVAVASSARIQHVMNDHWLHGTKEIYTRKTQTWDTTRRKKISTSSNMLYADAFKVNLAEERAITDHNFIAGVTIFICDITQIIKSFKGTDDHDDVINSYVGDQTLQLLHEIKSFMTETVSDILDRRKMLREMMLIDKMLELAITISESIQSSSMDLSAIYEQVMQILYNYVSSESDKSSEAIHLIQYLDFFISQLSHKNGVGFVVSRLMVELIKDRPMVIDSLADNHIDSFVGLARKSNSPRYLQLLGSVSVCTNIARAANQSRICKRLLSRNKLGILRFTLEDEEVHVTRTSATSEAQEQHVKLANYLNPASLSFTENKEYLLEEIALLEKLCHGRNQDCIFLIRDSVVDWNMLFHIIQHSSVADDIKAHFVRLLIVLYVDVGENTSILEQTLNTCRYDQLDVDIDFSTWLLDQVVYSDPQLTPKLPQLKNWLSSFIEEHRQLIASSARTNKFILSVLELMIKLTMFGYLTPVDLSALSMHLAYILDGRNDLPDERAGKLSAFARKRDNLVLRYQTGQRFNPAESSQIVVDVKYKIMEFFEYILRLCDEFYVVKLAAHFRTAVVESKETKKQSPLVQLLRPYNATHKKWSKRLQIFMPNKFNDPIKAIDNVLDSVLSETSSIIDKKQFAEILMDVSHYKYDPMKAKAIQLLSHLYNAKARMVDFAAQTQLLLTQESLALHHDICTFMPLLRRLLLVHIHTDQAETVNAILEKFMECCVFKADPDRPNRIGQHCLVNHGLVDLLVEVLQRPQIKDPPKHGEDWYASVSSNIMKLLRLMVKKNPEVQDAVFREIDIIMAVRSCPAALADMLCELFRHNADVSWKVSDPHVHQLVELVSEHQDRVPQLVSVLTSIIVADEQGTLIKRSQTLVMKHILRGYPKDAYVFDVQASLRCLILMGEEGERILQYTVNLINLFTLCAKGNRGSIRSFCQNVFTLREILTLLLREELSPNIKCHLLGYVTWVYLHLISASDKSTVGNPLLKRMLWRVIKSFIPDLDFCTELINTDTVSQSQLANMESSASITRGHELYPASVVFYILDAVLPFIRVFGRTFAIDNVNNPEEYRTIQSILVTVKSLLPWCASIISNKAHEDNIRSVMQLIGNWNNPEEETAWDAVRVSVERHFTLQRHSRISTYQKGAVVVLGQSPEDEARANKRFRVFMQNANKAILRSNTIHGQLALGRGHVAKKPYLPKEEVGRLPLSVGFQEQVKAYVNSKIRDVNLQYHSTLPLIEHLMSSGAKAKLHTHEASEPEILVNIKCLQILRTLLYNEIVLLPEYWEENAGKYQKRLKIISKLQTYLVEMKYLSALFMLLNWRDKKITAEVITMLHLLFFNANFTVQDAALEYFQSTREEVFFLVIEELFASSAMMLKERRSLQAQMRKSTPAEDPDLAKEDESKKVASKMSQIFSTATVNGAMNNAFHMVEFGKKIMKFPSSAEEADPVEARQKLSDVEVLKDDDIITVVLKMIAASCDGQHRAMQHYLRVQPDNLRSVNLVAVATQYLGVLCNSINKESLPLILQVFLTLLEVIQGNQENRLVVLNNKLIDYINLVLRNADIIKWAPVELHRLRGAIAECLIALLEESTSKGKSGVNIAKEVATQLDLNALLKVIEDCYTIVKWRWWSTFRKKKRNTVDVLNGIDPTPNVIEEVKAIGKKYVITYNQLLDAKSGDYSLDEIAHPSAKKALEFFRPYIASVEILKDNLVHKVYFCVSEKSDIRQEIKERLKWNIDRSSPSNKLRDFLLWARFIIQDIMYTRKVLSNPFARFCTNQWTSFNNLCIFLSIVINVIMLVTWQAPASGADVDGDNPDKAIIDKVKDPMPHIAIIDSYDTVLLGLGISHNVLSCLLIISYFLTATPSLPTPVKLVRWFRRSCGGSRSSEAESDRMEDAGLKVKADAATAFFSFKTMYYILFVVASFAGTFTMGYFFAFHLLNIVNVNVLLRHVIRAVTLNGSSLIWVAILGLILLYIYSLIAFAFFRLSFVPDDFGYCRTLYECAVTIIRFGLVGDIDENFRVNSLDLTFPNFTYVAIYQVTFFIIFTTILLNIIFGIIVDTFSELRDLKWHAEKDMQENCFICGRQAYEFEHHAKGFRHHVQYEHNQWTYILYFLYLSDTNPTDYTSIDIYVSELLKQDHYDFFPIDRALSLSALEGEEGESKIDSLARDIRFLVAREKYRIAETELERLDKRQKEWRQLIRVKDAMVGKYAKKAEPSLRKRLERIRKDRSREGDLGGLSPSPPESPPPEESPDFPRRDVPHSDLGEVEHSIPL